MSRFEIDVNNDIGRLDIQLLISLVAISKSPTLSSAAEKLHIPQPTMSLQMKRLEERAGHMLFMPGRRGKPLRLSVYGERLVRHATRIIEAYEDAIQSLSAAGVSGPIRLGIPALLAESGLHGVLNRIRNIYEDVNLTVIAADAQALKNMVADGRLDARICVDETHEYEGRVLWTESFHWVVGPDRKLLSRYPLPVALVRSGEPFRDYVAQLLDETGPQWFEAVTSDSMAKLYAAATSGQAVAAVPKSLITKDVAIVDGEMDLPELVQIPFAMYLSSSAQRNPQTLRIATSLGDFIEEKMRDLADRVFN